MTDNQGPRIEVKHNGRATNDPCALCGHRTDSVVGLEVFLEGTRDVVCRECAGKIDPAKLRWRDWAEAATAQAAGPPAAYPTGHRTLDFCRLGPMEQPVRCPVCRGQEVQFASLMCVMPNRQIMYLDHLGLQYYGSNMPDGFMPGATLVFRCAENHVFFRHYHAHGTCTQETGLAAHAGPGVLDELRPIWGTASRVEGNPQGQGRAAE